MLWRVPLILMTAAVLSGGSALAAAPGHDSLAAAREWLAAHPDDAETLRFLGRRLAAAERHAEAAGAFARAAALAPLDPDPVAHLAVLVRLGRMDEARALAEESEARQPARRAAPRGGALRLVARAMVAAGELGRARTLLDAALAQTPDDAALLVERARVESAAGRPVRAVAYLEEATRQAPADPAPLRELVRGLSAAGMPVRAVQAFGAAVKGGMAVDEGMLVAALDAMQAYGDHRAVVDLAERHAERFRKSAPLLRLTAVSLAALGAQERAAERLRQAVALAPPDAKVVALLEKDLPVPVSAAILKDLRRRFPWMPELFRSGGTPPRDQAWVWLREAEAMDRSLAAAHLARGVAEIPERRNGQRGRLLLRLAELEDTPEAALARLDRADALDAPRGDVLAARARVLAAAGRWDAAATVAWDWARTRPDDGAALDMLFTPEIAERVGWARVFAHLHDHVERDPEDPDRRLRALRRHVGTGGGAVLALAHAQALERLAGGDDPRHAEGRRLTDVLRRGLDGIGRLVDVDFDDARMVLDTPDGTVEARFHPVTGRLLRFAVGDRWIAARWSPDGLVLEALADWKGDAVTVTRRDGRLVAIEATGAGAFRAELGGDGNPTVVRLADGAADPAESYNAALALLSAWPRTGLAGARWLRIGG
ncbi:MAG: hypothetical protein AB1918_15325 [Pseudomonadota bacterium]